MSKKFLSLISVLFLMSVLVISCSNADKTGDGGTTPQGIAKYAGTWKLTPTTANLNITISNDGTVTFGDDKSTSVTDKGNEIYEVKFSPVNEEGEFTLTLKFNDDSNGTFTLSGKQNISGDMTKQKQQ